jgi:hypothetical protein
MREEIQKRASFMAMAQIRVFQNKRMKREKASENI